MKPLWLLLVLVLVAACVPEYVPPPGQATPEPKQALQTEPMVERGIPLVNVSVGQTRGEEHVVWGYDADGKLVLLNGSRNAVVLSYADGVLARIDDGVKPVTFAYKDGRLANVTRGVKHWVFKYNPAGDLVSMDNDEKVSVAYNSRGQMSKVMRDGGVGTEFAYDDQARAKTMYKGTIRTEFSYDGKGRLKLMSRQDDHLVIAYWRENLLSSLSGTMYGLKETVNYGPKAITLVSDVEQNEFASANADEAKERLHAFNTFLFCTRFRKLPVIFDGQSWVLFHEYFKGGIEDYLRISFVCDALP